MKRVIKLFLYSSQKELDKKNLKNLELTSENHKKLKNLLILGKEHFGKSKFLKEIFNKNFYEKLNLNFKNINLSDIYLLKATDTLNEWRIKAKVPCLLKKEDLNCEGCLKTTLNKDNCLLENLKNKIILVDDIDTIKSGKKLKILKEILQNAKLFILTSNNLDISKSLKNLLKEKETYVYEIKEPYFLENKLKISFKLKLDKNSYEEKENITKLLSLFIYLFMFILLIFNKVYLAIVVYLAFRYKDRLIKSFEKRR